MRPWRNFRVSGDRITVTAIPHRLTESDTYEGYYIPAGSIIIPNAWCVHHYLSTLQPQLFLGE